MRGYQTVDYQIETNHDFESVYVDDTKLFKNLIYSNNELRYNNEKLQNSHDRINKSKKFKKMSLKEIYEEFWEFIEDNNKEFFELIKKDQRRTSI